MTTRVVNPGQRGGVCDAGTGLRLLSAHNVIQTAFRSPCCGPVLVVKYVHDKEPDLFGPPSLLGVGVSPSYSFFALSRLSMGETP